VAKVEVEIKAEAQEVEAVFLVSVTAAVMAVALAVVMGVVVAVMGVVLKNNNQT
jgi:hypothetical protein